MAHKLMWDLKKHSSVVSVVHEVSQQRKDGIALEWKGQFLSYADLDARTTSLAEYLKDHFGVKRGTFVGLCIEPSFDMIVALLAVLKAGGVYVPLDPEFPKKRMATLLADANLPLVMTQQKFRIDMEMCYGLAGTATQSMIMDEDRSWTIYRSKSPIGFLPSEEDLAYILYTSGSTGEPKGVMIRHGGLVRLMDPIVTMLELGPKSRALQFGSLTFDLTTWEIFTALTAGSTLVLAMREDLLPGRPLAEFILHNRITMITMPPSILATIDSYKDSLPDLATIVAAGEACPLAIPRGWAKENKRAFFNGYGPTEATILATIYKYKHGDTRFPIGGPIEGWQTYLLDENLQPVPVGQHGEIYVGGHGVALGYLNKQELTAFRFVPNPFGEGKLYRTGDIGYQTEQGGPIEFVGRVDNQVKVNGFRIELEAIENALAEHPGVRVAAVMARELGSSSGGQAAKALVGYIVARHGVVETPTPSSLRKFLSERLPYYMVPPLYMFLDELPMMANRSKLNRKALPSPPLGQADGRPLSDMERRVARAFEEALDLPNGSFGADTNFFEMGGDSLRVARVVANLNDDFGLAIPSRHVYQGQTPATMTVLVDKILQAPDRAAKEEKVDIIKESTLEDDIRPLPHDIRPGAKPKVALLTGGTGFLGAYIIRDLLEFDPQLKLYCLVRGESVEHARERLKANFAKYRLDPGIAQRLHPVLGDVQQKNLGIETEQYRQLSLEVDTVFHSAADISYIRPYSALKGANVDGTRNVLRFSCDGRTKVLQYVSSVAVLGSSYNLLNAPVVKEDFDLDRAGTIMHFENGYIKSKWIAEKLVAQARDRGLPCSIYRQGFIEGDSQHGAAHFTDLLCRLIIGNIQLGAYQYFPEKFWLVVPVDYVSRSIAYLSVHGKLGTFQLGCPRQKESRHIEIFKLIGELGYPMQALPPDQYNDLLLAAPPNNALYPLVAFLTEKVYEGRNTIIEVHSRTSDYTDEDARAALAGSGIDCHPIDKTLIKRYVDFFIASGQLHSPPVHDHPQTGHTAHHEHELSVAV